MTLSSQKREVRCSSSTFPVFRPACPYPSLAGSAFAPHHAPCGKGNLAFWYGTTVCRRHRRCAHSSWVAADGAPRPPQPCCHKLGPWLCADSSAASFCTPAILPSNRPSSSTSNQQLQLLLALFRPAIKLVNTWTRLTKHSSRRKWGVCRNTPLHIVMADINSMLITLCTFQSHILKPFR